MDLQARCAWSTVNREHKEARVYPLSNGMFQGGFIVLVIGVITAIFTTRTPAFGSFFRAGLLFGGLAFAGACVALARTRRFLGMYGQRLVIGPTCLVIVDAEAVRILPAEQLSIASHSLGFIGKSIDHGVHPPTWLAELERAKEAAADPAAQEADRFRAAAAQARPWTASRVGWTRRVPALVASVAGVLVAFVLEAGPLHARAMSNLAAEAKAHSFRIEVIETLARRENFVIGIAADVDAAAKAAAREQLLVYAASEQEADLRVFLQKADADDPARLGVIDRLSVICTAKSSTKGLVGGARIVRLLEGIACVSASGTSFTFFYNQPGSDLTSGYAQQVADEIASKLRLSGAAIAKRAFTPPKGEPYLELKLTKEGAALGGMQGVKAVLTVRDARGGASAEPYTYSTKIPDPWSLSPTRKTPDQAPSMLHSNDTLRNDACPGGVTCGVGEGYQWCCPSPSRCYPSGPPGQRCIN